jgi:hypothetical protein
MHALRRQLRVLLIALTLLAELLSLWALPFPGRGPGIAHAAGAAPNAVDRPQMPVAGEPRPRFETSGAVGVPATFQAPAHVAAASVAAVESPNDWTPDLQEDFEGDLGDLWYTTDNKLDAYSYTWGLDNHRAHSGQWALRAGAGEPQATAATSARLSYPPNLDTWLITTHHFDLTQAQSALVEFYMWVDTEPNHDYVFVGASVDGRNYYGQTWSGWSGGWQYFALDLTAFIGYPQVTLGWYFQSDANNLYRNYEGVWLDDVTVWTYVDTPPAQGVDYIENGGFESGDLSGWSTLAGAGVAVQQQVNPVAGSYVAGFGGIDNAQEVLYQTITLPGGDVAGGTLGFWLNLFSQETNANADFFCAGIRDDAGTELLVDLGCLDAVEAVTSSFSPDAWWQVEVPLTGADWAAIQGQTVHVVFEMYTDGANHTVALLDDVRFELVSGGAGDALEPNDSAGQATPATIGASMNALTIAPDGDEDFFRITAGAGDTLLVDINAAIDGSALDSVVTVLDAQGATMCYNDDDGHTFDSYLACTLAAAGDYYVVVSSYDGRGDRNYHYAITIYLNPGDNAPGPGDDPDNTTRPPSGAARSWTAILYLDGDNNLCFTFPEFIRHLERDLNHKIGPNGFLNIVVLFDRSPDPAHGCNGQGGASRFVVQPNGGYTPNVTSWNMGEVNMGNPQTLVNFANWAMHNYPAEHYYLAIVNHGGAVHGIASDDTSGGDIIDNAELYQALKEITRNGERKIDLLNYQACLMGTYENAYDVRNFVDYLFFFPTISWASSDGYLLPYFVDPNFTAASTGLDLGNILYDTYNAVFSSMPYVVSLVDAGKLDALHQAVNNWAGALLASLPASSGALRAARSAAQKVEINLDDIIDNGDYMLDLWDVADGIAAQGLAVAQANALKQAIDDAVIRYDIWPGNQWYAWDYSGAHGLTIFWPETPSGVYQAYVSDAIYSVTQQGSWDEFLAAYFGDTANRNRPALSNSTGIPQVQLATPGTPAAPAAPSVLTATAVSPYQIDLAWTDNAANETATIVERSLDNETWAAIQTLGPGATTFQDQGLKPQTTYHYRVKASNAGGDSAYSPIATAETLVATGTLSGIVFLDGNRNGQQDAGEAGIPGIAITVRSANGAVRRETTTGADGSYTIQALPIGPYSVTAAIPASYGFTTPGAIAVEVTEQGAAVSPIGLVGSAYIPYLDR